MAQLIADGFESGDFSAWSVSGTPTISTAKAHRGTHSMIISAAQTSQFAFINVAAGKKTIGGKLYLLPTSGGTPIESPLSVEFSNAGATVVGVLIISVSGGQFFITWENWRDTAAEVERYTGTVPLIKDQWNLVQWKAFTNAATGTVQTKVNGTIDINVSAKNSGGSDIVAVSLGQSNTGASGFDYYIDDVALDDANLIAGDASLILQRRRKLYTPRRW